MGSAVGPTTASAWPSEMNLGTLSWVVPQLIAEKKRNWKVSAFSWGQGGREQRATNSGALPTSLSTAEGQGLNVVFSKTRSPTSLQEGSV